VLGVRPLAARERGRAGSAGPELAAAAAGSEARPSATAGGGGGAGRVAAAKQPLMKVVAVAAAAAAAVAAAAVAAAARRRRALGLAVEKGYSQSQPASGCRATAPFTTQLHPAGPGSPDSSSDQLTGGPSAQTFVRGLV